MGKLSFEDKINLYIENQEYQFHHCVQNIKYYILMLNI